MTYDPLTAFRMGGSLRFTFDTHSHAAVNAIQVPVSDTAYAVPNGPSPGGRQRLLTVAARGRWAEGRQQAAERHV
jgi:hypothetical protein